jgi:hypothetical protein
MFVAVAACAAVEWRVQHFHGLQSMCATHLPSESFVLVRFGALKCDGGDWCDMVFCCFARYRWCGSSCQTQGAPCGFNPFIESDGNVNACPFTSAPTPPPTPVGQTVAVTLLSLHYPHTSSHSTTTTIADAANASATDTGRSNAGADAADAADARANRAADAAADPQSRHGRCRVLRARPARRRCPRRSGAHAASLAAACAQQYAVTLIVVCV